MRGRSRSRSRLASKTPLKSSAIILRKPSKPSIAVNSSSTRSIVHVTSSTDDAIKRPVTGQGQSAILIDAAYLNHASKNSGKWVDPADLVVRLRAVILAKSGTDIDEGILERHYFATDIFANKGSNNAAMKANFCLKTYELKDKGGNCKHCQKYTSVRVQAGADVGFVTRLMRLATDQRVDVKTFILVAGDGDFKDAYEFVKDSLRKQIWVVGWKGTIKAELMQFGQVILLDDLLAAAAPAQIAPRVPAVVPASVIAATIEASPPPPNGTEVDGT
jgi:uncharacterized LabA/DUF88 family protein